MVRDNSPKQRQQRQLERKTNNRASYDRVLIVSEGSKTEPNYFKEIRAYFRLLTANVEVRPSEFGTAPIQVVDYAKALFVNGDTHRRLPARAFDRVYVVFDRDDHESYLKAIDLANSLDGKLKNDDRKLVAFKVVASVPCFELWLLLHYEAIHAPIHRSEVMKRLKRYFPAYEKGMGGVFGNTHAHLELAISRAEALTRKNTVNSGYEPYTNIHELVGFLISLRSGK